VGTTDFNFQDQQTVLDDTLSDNHKGEARFRATQSGLMPVEFLTIKDSCNVYDSDPGPYDFIATVKHGLRAAVAVASRSGHRTRFQPTVYGPDGSSIDDTSQFTIDLLWLRQGSWRQVRSSLSFGEFSISWAKKDRGHRQYIKIRVHGPGYQTATSRTLSVKAR
jgi:hypothetical protein